MASRQRLIDLLTRRQYPQALIDIVQRPTSTWPADKTTFAGRKSSARSGPASIRDALPSGIVEPPTTGFEEPASRRKAMEIAARLDELFGKVST